jgi:hypothetical protein
MAWRTVRRSNATCCLESGAGLTARDRSCVRPLPLAQHSGNRERHKPDCSGGRVHDEDRRQNRCDDGPFPGARRVEGNGRPDRNDEPRGVADQPNRRKVACELAVAHEIVERACDARLLSIG